MSWEYREKHRPHEDGGRRAAKKRRREEKTRRKTHGSDSDPRWICQSTEWCVPTEFAGSPVGRDSSRRGLWFFRRHGGMNAALHSSTRIFDGNDPPTACPSRKSWAIRAHESIKGRNTRALSSLSLNFDFGVLIRISPPSRLPFAPSLLRGSSSSKLDTIRLPRRLTSAFPKFSGDCREVRRWPNG